MLILLTKYVKIKKTIFYFSLNKAINVNLFLSNYFHVMYL